MPATAPAHAPIDEAHLPVLSRIEKQLGRERVVHHVVHAARVEDRAHSSGRRARVECVEGAVGRGGEEERGVVRVGGERGDGVLGPPDVSDGAFSSLKRSERSYVVVEPGVERRDPFLERVREGRARRFEVVREDDSIVAAAAGVRWAQSFRRDVGREEGPRTRRCASCRPKRRWQRCWTGGGGSYEVRAMSTFGM